MCPTLYEESPCAFYIQTHEPVGSSAIAKRKNFIKCRITLTLDCQRKTGDDSNVNITGNQHGNTALMRVATSKGLIIMLHSTA